MSDAQVAATWAVVVNWNGGEDNLECVASLLAQGLAPEHIVFVDNASSDGSTEAVLDRHPGIVVVRNDRNVGYGDATNQGIELSLEGGAELVFLVNNDVVLPARTLAGLIAAFAEGIGLVGPRIVYKEDPGLLWCAGGRMTYRQNLTTMIGHRKADGPAYQSSRPVDYVPGCAMLVRSEVFREAGLLEGDYFAYHEDVEFCLKAREHGFSTWMIGEVLALHGAHQSTGGGYNPRRKYMMGVNTVWFLRRHGTPLRWLSFFVFDVLSLPFVWLARLPRGEGRAVWAKARGMLAGLRGERVTEDTLR